jgi:hypothetical protein
MSSQKKGQQSGVDRVMDAFGKLLPQCDSALYLAEIGSTRKLNLIEQVSFKYHSNLCIYCSCKRDKLDQMKTKML